MVEEILLSLVLVLMVAFVFLIKQGKQTLLTTCSSSKCTVRGKQMVMNDCSKGCVTPFGINFATTFQTQSCLPPCMINAFRVTNTSPCQGESDACVDGTEAFTVTSTCEIADGIGFQSCNLGETTTQKIPCQRNIHTPSCGTLILPGGVECSSFDPFFQEVTFDQTAETYGSLQEGKFAATCSSAFCASQTCNKQVHLVGNPTDLGNVDTHKRLFGKKVEIKLAGSPKFLTAHVDGTLSREHTTTPGANFVITNYQVPDSSDKVTGQMVAVDISPRVTFNFTMGTDKYLAIAGWSTPWEME